MARTELSLEVSNSKDQKLMRLVDTSFYCEEVADNYLIEILPVNKSAWIPFHVKKEFSLTVNSSSLLYKKVSDITGLVNLPDGIYEFKQSIKPNINTLVHFLHLRTVELSNKVSAQRDNLFKNKCSHCSEEYFKNLSELRDIQEFIDAAEWAVEQCHDKERGKEMYEWAKKLLEQYTNDCQC